MFRGSRPGERRGGRKRGTPNRRTILRDRILSIGLDDPAASQHAFLLKLVKDPKLPADIRIAIAPACFPAKRPSRAGRPRALAGSRTGMAREALATNGAAVGSKLAGSRTGMAREALATNGAAVGSKGSHTAAAVPSIRDWTPQALDALFGVVQDAGAEPKERRKAALRIAQFLLPKAGKKPKIIPDEYGFLINPNLASAYRDIKFELWALRRGPTRKIPAIAQKIEKLQTRADAFQRRLEMPWPTQYGDKEADNDFDRLMELSLLRGNGTALTEAQKAQEAHLWARYDVFRASPPSIARRRREALERTDRWFKMYRLNGDFDAPSLSRKERHELKFLRRFFPAEATQSLSPLEHDETGRDHPFLHELPLPDGNFYPRHSKLRPGPPNEDAEKAHLAPGEARIYELEERRAAGSQLTAPEEKELRDLRQRHPEYAAAIDLMDLLYLHYYRREFEIARKAGVDIDAIREHADACCLRFRDPSKFLHEWQARRYLLEQRPPGRPVGSHEENIARVRVVDE